MEKNNLVLLVKYEEGKDNVLPTEQHILCMIHYEKLKEKYSDFKLNESVSSIPKVWCEVCTPPEY
jgi:hypothetical protein